MKLEILKQALAKAGLTKETDTSSSPTTKGYKKRKNIRKQNHPPTDTKLPRIKKIPRKQKKQYRKNVISLTKLRLSEEQADSIIKSLGFKNQKEALNYWIVIRNLIKKNKIDHIVEILSKNKKHTPGGKSWSIDSFNQYHSAVQLFFKKFQKETKERPPVSRKEIQTPLRSEEKSYLESVKTEELFSLYLQAIKRTAKENQNLQIEGKKDIERINKEFLRRFEGSVDENGYFIWPHTKVSLNNSQRSKSIIFDQESGALSLYGYRVGKTHGEPDNIRRLILDEVFNANIPPVFERSYLSQWGSASTAKRLQKMAQTIASLTRNEKLRGSKYAVAYTQREEDLSYLHRKYYIGQFNFDWPKTT